MNDTKNNPLMCGDARPRFDLIEAHHIDPAIDVLVKACEQALEAIIEQHAPPSFTGLSRALDVPFQALDAAWGSVLHLQGLCDSTDLREAISRSQPRVTGLHARLKSDLRLYRLYQRVWEEEGDALSAARSRALQNSLRGFLLSGAELDDEKKAEFAQSLQRSAELGRQFANNLQDATDAPVYWVEEAELEGVPAGVRASLAAAAAADGREGCFKVTLQQPCLGPLMQYAQDRRLRAMLYRDNVTRASELGPPPLDNGPVMAAILTERQRRAQLLGYAQHAQVSLVTKMADSPEQVVDFLRDLARRARPRAQAELDELREFAASKLSLPDLQAWDVPYASERLRQERYSFGEQDVRNHFQFEQVIEGLFSLATELFSVQIRAETLPVWHPDVRSYRLDRDGELLGHLQLDPFARRGKRGGAWMSGAQPRWRRPDGSMRAAWAYLVTNFSAPVPGSPALLRHEDVVTLFHEFGHALHFLLSRVDVLGVSGISGVEWDAVELPSQLFENFAWKWEVLQRITAHVETGEALPRDLFDKMLAARHFQGALQLTRQVELALFDMQLHLEPALSGRVQQALEDVRDEIAVLRPPAFNRFANGFSHVFAGAYAAGYYSYLWAEVLACDVWSHFDQAGTCAPEVGVRYCQTILEVGGSRSMAESFQAFAGRGPSSDALLTQLGLPKA